MLTRLLESQTQYLDVPGIARCSLSTVPLHLHLDKATVGLGGLYLLLMRNSALHQSMWGRYITTKRGLKLITRKLKNNIILTIETGEVEHVWQSNILKHVLNVRLMHRIKFPYQEDQSGREFA